MKKNNKGFSLIELSIVLIIMGLLIAGVTGGASLIKSAKLRSVITEFTNYRTAYNTYYAQFGKVPGACNDDANKICSYDAFNVLFNEGIIDREPIDDAIASKFGGNVKWYLFNTISSTATIDSGSFVIGDFNNINVLSLSYDTSFATPVLTAVEIKTIDEKVDDGKSKSGLVRGIFAEAGGDYQEQEYDYNTEYTTEKGKHWSLVSKMDF